MSKNAFDVPLDSAPVERRRMRRKRVLLSGVVASENGENAADCTIRDLSARGAQVQLRRTLQAGAEVYLVDTRNETAHLAKVAWTDGTKAGLSFVRSYSLESTLPPPLEFLGGLLIEAKLRHVHALIRRGVPVEEATRVVGLSEDYLEQFSKRGLFEERVALLLRQAKQLFSK